MKTDSTLTQAEFFDFLEWLDPDPDRAADKYEGIRRRLIWFYLNRQCSAAEDLTDEVINRVARKPKEWKDAYVGDRMPYFHAVANKVFLEHLRELNRKIEPPPETTRAEIEPRLDCLRKCLAALSDENRRLILPYYEERKRAKINLHKEMGSSLGVSPGALRARVHRIRTKLRECVERCLRNFPESNNIDSDDI